MKKQFAIVAFTIIVMVLGFLWVSFILTLTAGASSDNTVAVCDTVNDNSVAAYNGHTVDSMDANTRHCVAVGNNDHKQNDKQDKPTVTVLHVVVDNMVPAVNSVPVVKQDKNHCNNGEGNGPEKCSPAKSPNANNDENHTTPKQDKSH